MDFPHWPTWREFWALTCPAAAVKTPCRLRPPAAACGGTRPRCWRDKRWPRCWRTERASRLSGRWRMGTGGGPQTQRKRCWGSRERWSPQCCGSCRACGRREAWNRGTGVQNQDCPGAGSPTLRCRTAPNLMLFLLLWWRSAGTGAPHLHDKNIWIYCSTKLIKKLMWWSTGRIYLMTTASPPQPRGLNIFKRLVFLEKCVSAARLSWQIQTKIFLTLTRDRAACKFCYSLPRS